MKRPSLLAWLWTLLIFVLCWLPRMYIPGQENLPKPLLVINLDKLVHMGIFAGFSFLWMRVGTSRFQAIRVLLVGVALAAITEIGQESRFVNRDASVADGLADVAGVAVGIGAWWLVSRFEAGRPGFKTRSSETP